MKEIELTQGYVALVDDEDYERLAKFKWYLLKNRTRKTQYANRWDGKGHPSIKMHREVLMVTSDVDHIDGNGLNNQKANLRVAAPGQNAANAKKRRDGTSKYKGVCLRKRSWVAGIKVNYVRIHIGCFASEDDAAKAYDDEARRRFGEFACVNFPRPGERGALAG